MATAADAAYFREALERAMAFGRIDRAEFHEREMSVAARWVERYTPAGRAADPQAELLSWIRRQLYIAGALDPADRKRVEQGELPLPGTQMPKLFAFEEPLPVPLLAHRPTAWSSTPQKETQSPSVHRGAFCIRSHRGVRSDPPAGCHRLGDPVQGDHIGRKAQFTCFSRLIS